MIAQHFEWTITYDDIRRCPIIVLSFKYIMGPSIDKIKPVTLAIYEATDDWNYTAHYMQGWNSMIFLKCFQMQRQLINYILGEAP